MLSASCSKPSPHIHHDAAAQVKLPDLNLLLYAIDEEAPRHEPARGWLEEALSGTEAAEDYGWGVRS